MLRNLSCVPFRLKHNILAAIALCALLVSVWALMFTSRSVRNQELHNRLSVKPIPNIVPYRYHNRIGVLLRNVGVGPLLVTKLYVYKKDQATAVRSNIISWIPKPPTGVLWSEYYRDLEDHAVEAGCERTLIELDWSEITSTEKRKLYREYGQQVRAILRTLVIELDYQDIYGQSFHMKPSEKLIRRFGG